MSRSVRATALLALAGLASATACSDGFGPLEWDSDPVAVAIYSLARQELLGLPSALDLASRPIQLVRVELPGQTGLWDVALSEQDGAFVLLPAGAVEGIPVGPGIAVIEDQTFEDLRRAPADSAAYARTEPVPLRTGVVYVIRTGRRPGFSCVYYAKARVVELDAAAGRLDIDVVRNPYCSDRFLLQPSER